jgi:TPR repeat protein
MTRRATPWRSSASGIVTTPDRTGIPPASSNRRTGRRGGQFRLAQHYYDERTRNPEEDVLAQKWLRLTADQGDARAEDRLGWIYYRGNGVPQTYAEAARWFRRGAEHGNPDAMTRLGNLYRDGGGVNRDLAEGRKWINRASEISSRSARLRQNAWLAAIVVGVPGFAGSLTLLQKGTFQR